MLGDYALPPRYKERFSQNFELGVLESLAVEHGSRPMFPRPPCTMYVFLQAKFV